MTETLEARIRRHEGFRSRPYLDTTGHFTIGFGHLVTECQANNYANGISEHDAEDLLHADIAKAQAGILGMMPWVANIDPIRRDILTEMAFQLGVDGLFHFRNLLYCIRQGNFPGAAREMLDSRWHQQTPHRCEELASLMLHGEAV